MRESFTRAIPVLAVAMLIPVASAGATADDGAREAVAPGLHVGDVLDETNWHLAKDLLPPEVLRHYERGEYRNKIVSYPLGNAKWEKAFLEATEKNASQFDVNENGSVVYSSTGEPPEYFYGIPFPHIDPEDPGAGVKIIWNQFLAYWAGGSSYNVTLVAMLQPKGMDRRLHADGWFIFFDGQSKKYRQKNPLNLQSQFLGVASFPADLQGTASLTWRYRDPLKRDSVWAFVPALRRVRAVSPANRSDGYLGSDFSGDDSFFFDGKPEDFTFKLVGRRDALRIVDPATVSGAPVPVDPVPGGGWRVLTENDNTMAGFEDPSWTGVSWAPVSAGLAKRPFWIVEAVPKDKYYLYGKLELWIDAETWDGSWHRKFNWNGELVHGLSVMGRVNQPVGPGDDTEYVPSSTLVWACAENYKLNRATLGGMRAYPKAPFLRRMPIDAKVFDPQALHMYGK